MPDGGAEHRPSPSERALFAGELLGAPVRLEAAGALRAPVEGTVVDESLSTLIVRPTGGARTVRVPKAGVRGTILLGGRELPLSGELLRVRPEDRTKRVLAPGPRRSA
jgi:RNase P/RNase MRP subunit p29